MIIHNDWSFPKISFRFKCSYFTQDENFNQTEFFWDDLCKWRWNRKSTVVLLVSSSVYPLLIWRWNILIVTNIKKCLITLQRGFYLGIQNSLPVSPVLQAKTYSSTYTVPPLLNVHLSFRSSSLHDYLETEWYIRYIIRGCCYHSSHSSHCQG